MKTATVIERQAQAIDINQLPDEEMVDKWIELSEEFMEEEASRTKINELILDMSNLNQGNTLERIEKWENIFPRLEHKQGLSIDVLPSNAQTKAIIELLNCEKNTNVETKRNTDNSPRTKRSREMQGTRREGRGSSSERRRHDEEPRTTKRLKVENTKYERTRRSRSPRSRSNEKRHHNREPRTTRRLKVESEEYDRTRTSRSPRSRSSERRHHKPEPRTTKRLKVESEEHERTSGTRSPRSSSTERRHQNRNPRTTKRHGKYERTRRASSPRSRSRQSNRHERMSHNSREPNRQVDFEITLHKSQAYEERDRNNHASNSDESSEHR
jgi:hypothetical protein